MDRQIDSYWVGLSALIALSSYALIVAVFVQCLDLNKSVTVWIVT